MGGLRWYSNSQQSGRQRHDPCPVQLRRETKPREADEEPQFRYFDVDQAMQRLSRARLRRGYLLPGESLYEVY